MGYKDDETDLIFHQPFMLPINQQILNIIKHWIFGNFFKSICMAVSGDTGVEIIKYYSIKRI